MKISISYQVLMIILAAFYTLHLKCIKRLAKHMVRIVWRITCLLAAPVTSESVIWVSELFRESVKEQAKGLLTGAAKFQVSMSIAYGLLTPSFNKPVVFYFGKCMNYKDRLTEYTQGRLSELSDADGYEPDRPALTNLLWFPDKVISNEVIAAKLKIMSDADRKRMKYLSGYDGNESLYDDEYSKAESTVAKECLKYLQNRKEVAYDWYRKS